MYSCCFLAIVLSGELSCSSVCIPGFVAVVYCCYVLGVMLVCYTLFWVLLCELVVLFSVIWVDHDFRCSFGIGLLL